MTKYATLSVQKTASDCDHSFSVQVQGQHFQGAVTRATQSDKERERSKNVLMFLQLS